MPTTGNLQPDPSLSTDQDGERLGRESSDHLRQFNDLLVSLCLDFINRPVEELTDGLTNALGRIGQFTGADWCYIYQFSDDGTTAKLTHSWTAEVASELSPPLDPIPTDRFAWEIRQILDQREFLVPDSRELPLEATGLRWLCDTLGIKSAAYLPLVVNDRLVGSLGFCHVRAHSSWTTQDVAIVRVLAEVLQSVLQRSHDEQALHKSEIRFRKLVRDQSDLVVVCNPAGKQTYVNEAVCRFFQTPVDEILGTSIYRHIHIDDRPAVRTKLATLTIEKPVATDERRVVLPDGSIAWHQWVDRAYFNDAGEPTEYQSVGRDISELKQVQRELEHRLGFEDLILSLSTKFINLPTERFDAKFNDALRQVSQFTGVCDTFVYLFDEQQQESRLYDAWSVSGLPPAPEPVEFFKLTKCPWSMGKLRRGEPIHVPTPDSLPAEAHTFRQRIEQLGVKSCINVPMLLGREVVGHLGCSCYKKPKLWTDSEIALLRLLGEVLINALKRREAEQALAGSERRHRLTVESLEEGIFDWNFETGQAFSSDYLKREVGVDPKLPGWTYDEWADRVHEDDRPSVIANLTSHLEGRSPIYNAEYRFRTEGRGYRWMLSRGRVVEFRTNGKPLRMVGVQRDITEQIEQREEWRRQETRMVHLGRVTAMGETVAGIAHEVNQPLHAASAYCAAARQALQSNRTDSRDKAMQMCEQAANQVQRAGDIIRKIREFTRPRPTKITAVKINDVITRTVELTDQIGASRNVRVNVELDATQPQVCVDEIQLQQIVVNLIQNACDSLISSETPAPLIRVTTSRQGKFVEVVVSDNASTPTPENTEAFFEAFYTTKDEGMGIGLALCRTILTSLGGEIRAEPNVESGMTLRFRLPLEEGAV